MRLLSAFLGVCLFASVTWASVDPDVDLPARAKGANRVVVATVTDVKSAFAENDDGDRLIVSEVTVRIDETLKGPHAEALVVTLEGGTVGNLTLEVSDMPRMEKGQRAVLFLTNSRGGGNIPHGRGAGVMKLDGNNRVTDADLTLDDIRGAVKGTLGSSR